MRKSAIIVILLILVSSAGCAVKKEAVQIDPPAAASADSGAADSAGSITQIIDASYTESAIKIGYPQLSASAETPRQKEINDLIKNEVMEIVDGYKSSGEEYHVDIAYQIKWQGANILSIVYTGYANLTGAAYPANVQFTTNIDLKNGRILKLSDCVRIDPELVRKFQQGRYQPWGADLNLQSADALGQVMDSLDSSDLLAQFQQEKARFYFTRDSLGISADVVHAVGDHLEMEIPFSALQENMIDDNQIWQDFSGK